MPGTDLFPSVMYPDRTAFEAVGFSFGEEAGDAFVRCRMPDGWSRRPGRTHKLSEVVDAAGNVRVLVSRNVVGGMRWSEADLTCRHSVDLVHGPGTYAGVALEEGTSAIAVLDAGFPVKVFDVRADRASGNGPGPRGRWLDHEAAMAWLDAMHPGNDDPVASWRGISARH